MAVEYTVYESGHTKDARRALRQVAHPVAHYTSFSDMMEHWFAEIVDGTHVFFKTVGEA